MPAHRGRTIGRRRTLTQVGIRTGGAVPVFAGTLFLSALLLFSLQPMFTRMVLPIWGGSPAVWSTALLFFQSVLLAGYLYVHLLRRLSLPVQAGVHLSLLLLAAATLPVDVVMPLPADAAPPAVVLLTVLAASIGLPFFLVSTSAPLLMHWFSRTGDPHADDPYFLYGASNLGSLAALLSYPPLIEPLLGLRQQGESWSLLYLLLVAAVALCLWWSRRSFAPAQPLHTDTGAGQDTPLPARRIGRWLLLSFVPSSLLLGVTRHISTDVAAAPFLWVVPLVLFLLTFVLVFARRPPLPHRLMLRVQAVLLAALLLAYGGRLLLDISLHLLAFFATAMVCHGELARDRPEARRLTAFFVWIAVGGALGGLFAALIAPALFTGVWEYPLTLLLACLIRPAAERFGEPGQAWRDLVLPLCLAAVYLSALYLWGGSLPHWLTGGSSLLFDLAAALLLLGFAHRRWRFALGFALLTVAPPIIDDASDLVERRRSFFGVHTVERDAKEGVNLLYHGTTIHGASYPEGPRRREPQTYYTNDGPLGQAVAALSRDAPLRRVGAIGLGVGSLACLFDPHTRLVFYEIDADVIALARDARLFGYLDACGANTELRLGDGRLEVAAEADGSLDMIVVDAFSSDAIPVHLITREAVALYRRKLAPGGVLLFHVSNKYVDLRPVLAALARDAGLVGLFQAHATPDDPAHPYAFDSDWVALAAAGPGLSALTADARWEPLSDGEAGRLWTDDFADVFGALIWREREMEDGDGDGEATPR